jgi:hypothetical protein
MHVRPHDTSSSDRLPTIRPLEMLDDAWRRSSGGERLIAVETAAPRLREAIEASGTVLAVRTFEIGRFPYPTQFAFGGACTSTIPYVWLMNRAVLIEYRDLGGARRRLLANPSRPDGARKAPYFQKIYGPVPSALVPSFEHWVGRRGPPLPMQLEKAGIAPSSIDFITFDHLHVQELGPSLGPTGEYPNARLLVTKDELLAARNLHPLQRYWYTASVLDGVSEENLCPFSGDILLGEGLALVHTPGHTDGNHTIVFHLPDGIMTVSENGVAPECYAPELSDVPGLREHARRTGERAILNSNTRERTLDQYTSMRLEAVLAQPKEAGQFPRHFSSSELTHTWMAPGIRPVFAWRSVTYGVL